MKLLVRYVDFHADNYQGGSGKSFEFNTVVTIPNDTKAIDILEEMHRQIRKIIEIQRPFIVKYERQSPAIQCIEVIE